MAGLSVSTEVLDDVLDKPSNANGLLGCEWQGDVAVNKTWGWEVL